MNGYDLNPTALICFAVARWLVIVLTGCSFTAMGVELRWRGGPVKWCSFSFSLKKRIGILPTVIGGGPDVQGKHQEWPVFRWSMALFGAAIGVIPILAFVVYLAES